MVKYIILVITCSQFRPQINLKTGDRSQSVFITDKFVQLRLTMCQVEKTEFVQRSKLKSM